MALSRPELDKLKATYRKPGVVLPDIERHVLKLDLNEHRDTAHVHASDMASANWCHRHTYWRCIGTPVETKPTSYGFAATSALITGNDTHAKHQGWLEKMGVLHGLWRCPNCKHERFGKRELFCNQPNCTGVPRYREVPFVSDRYLLWSHADALIERSDRFVLGEIKSIGQGTLRYEALPLYDALAQKLKSPDEVWNSIKHPFPSHLRQGQVYLRLMELCYPEYEVDTIVFLYEWKFTNECKEFVVKRSHQISQPLFDRALEVAVGVRTGGEVMPSFPDWAGRDVPFCQSCDYYRTCHGIEQAHVDKTEEQPRVVKIQKTSSSKRRRALKRPA